MDAGHNLPRNACDSLHIRVVSLVAVDLSDGCLNEVDLLGADRRCRPSLLLNVKNSRVGD